MKSILWKWETLQVYYVISYFDNLNVILGAVFKLSSEWCWRLYYIKVTFLMDPQIRLLFAIILILKYQAFFKILYFLKWGEWGCRRSWFIMEKWRESFVCSRTLGKTRCPGLQVPYPGISKLKKKMTDLTKNAYSQGHRVLPHLFIRRIKYYFPVKGFQ